MQTFVRLAGVSLAGGLVAIALAGAGQAGELGPEWRALSEDETRIVFDTPALSGATKRFMKGQAESYSHTTEIGIWTKSSSKVPVAEVYFVQAAPGRHYRKERDLKRFIRQWHYLKGDEPTWRDRGSAPSLRGRVTYQAFSGQGFECFAFKRYWDPGGGVDMSVGTKAILGMYCDPSGTLSSEKISDVLKGLGVRDRNAAKNARTAAPAQDSGPGSCGPATEGQPLRADAFNRVITDYYKRHPLKKSRHHDQPTEISEIEETEVVERSGRILTVMVKYHWQAGGGVFGGGTSRAVATVESCGSSYRVVAFE